jgi:hypothetical protein
MYFDIAMPLTLFATTLASVLLSEKLEDKLKVVFEERQFTSKDATLLVILMSVVITLVATSSRYGFINPLMVLFLFSCSALLFTFAYLLLDKRWYLAMLPPAFFIVLYALLRDSLIWSLYLMNLYAVIFAILATLYLGSIFTWKATWVFAILITIIDVILVFVTKSMIEAAKAGLELKLPIFVIIPTFPVVGKIGLGLGDFFLAGLLSVQLLKKYGKKYATLSVVTISAAFFIFELYSFNYQPQWFPATLIVISGWLPIALWRSRYEIKRMLNSDRGY